MSTDRRQENRFLVFTDIIGHTKMFARVGPAFRQLRERHDRIFLDAVKQHDPHAIVKGTGDGFYAGFEQIGPAVEVALAFRRGIASENWHAMLPEDKRTSENVIRCRIGIHAGQVNLLGDPPGDIDGAPRSLGEKLMGMAGANQVLASRAVRDAARSTLSQREDLVWTKFGEYKLRDVPDTLDLWSLSVSTGGGDDFAPGARPVQPPEHRVILFSTIDDYAAVLEKLGPKFIAQKDQWDAAFAKAAGEHGPDAFIKRLPDGTLAAFKSSLAAIRAANAFRRALKHQSAAGSSLSPMIALESGLVTFEYENNQPIDVRDQAVNIPAKMVKTGMVRPWQLILTRPVREDAWANLPEREEFKWVCQGKKPVPGEPEPIELWEFHDVQSKLETRAIVWVDARDARKHLGGSPDSLGKFEGQLAGIVVGAMSGRAEEPWTLPVDSGTALAFKDPVEAVICARDIHARALAEPWERTCPGVKRAGKKDNLLRLAIHLGQLRVNLEDGLLKEFKGPAVDGARPLADACRSGQILVSRDARDAVAAGFTSGEVVFRKFEEPGTDAFELRGPERAKLALFSAGGLAVVAAVIGALYFGGVLSPRAPGPDMSTSWVAGKELPSFLDRDIARAPQDAQMLVVLEQVRQAVMRIDEQRSKAGADQKTRGRELLPVSSRLEQLYSDYKNAMSIDDVVREHAPKLAGVGDMTQLGAWFDGLASYKKLAGDPRTTAQWGRRLDELRGRLEKFAVSDPGVSAAMDQLRRKIDEAGAGEWVQKNEEAIRASAASINAALAPGAELDARITALVSGKQERQAAEVETLRAINTKLDASPVSGGEWAFVQSIWREAGIRFGKLKEHADATALASLRTRVEGAFAALASVPEKFPLSLRADEPGWLQGVVDELASRRREMVQGAAEALTTSQAGGEALSEASAAWMKLVESVRGPIEALRSAESAMNDATLLDERAGGVSPVGSVSVGQLLLDASAGIKPHPRLSELVRPVLERGETLRQIAQMHDVGEIKRTSAAGKRSTPEVVRACWARLGDASLMDSEGWLDAQAEVYNDLSNLTGLSGAARARVDQGATQIAQRWLAYFPTLSDEGSIKRALALRGTFGVPDALLGRLPTHARYNLRLMQIKEAARAPESPEAEEALKRTVTGVLGEDYASLAGKPEAGAVLAALKDPLAAAKQNTQRVDPSSIDPQLIGPALAGWKLVAHAGDAYTYELEGPADAAPVRMEFVRLNVPEQGGAQSVVYVATSEVSLGTLIAVVDKARAWSTLQAGYTKQPDRRGPLVWSWPEGSRGKPMVLVDEMVKGKRSWVPNKPILNNTSYYPPGSDPGEPTLDMPMNYVTPPVAGFVARLMNCRLISSAEWRAALAREGCGSNPSGWNLRDQSLRKVIEHFGSAVLTGLHPPDVQSYAKKSNDKSYYDFDDGYVWFAPVGVDVGGRSRTFHHLIGNVAELVFEKPEMFEGMRIGNYDDVAKVTDTKENRDATMVIGGSALCAKLDAEGLTSAQSVARVRNLLFENGCSDVGFRVAFSPVLGEAPASYTQAVLRAVDKAPFVTP